MTDRHALLIGVASCDNDLFEALPDAVGADISRMTDVLTQSSYTITHCGVGNESAQEPTGNRIRAAILKALRDSPPDGVLLVYFSGHGVTIDGKSYLVPQDVYTESDKPATESLVPLIPGHLNECRAKLILFIVDACRNDLSGEFANVEQSGTLPYPSNGAFVLFNSCRPGERSLYGDTGSYFTQAVVEVLDRRHPARTLDDIHQAVVRILARKAVNTENMDQTADLAISQRTATRFSPTEVVVCDGDRVGEAWRRAVEDTHLWQKCGNDLAALEHAKSAVLTIVDECARHWVEAQDVLLSRTGLADPWAAHDYPVRVLGAANRCLSGDIELTPIELATLIAVPFLRETALSFGLKLASSVEPANFTRSYQDGPRSDLELTHAMHEHVCRRAEGLGRRGRTVPRDALAMWLVHQWLASRPSVWTDQGTRTLCERFARVASGTDISLTEREWCSTLLILIECIGADPADQRLIDALRNQIFSRRIRALAATLWLAGVMAADPRRAPTVVADHVGIGAEVQLSALHAATVNASWQRSSDTFILHAVCDHPALLAMFQEVTRRAASVRNAIDQIDLDPDLAKLLPGSFSHRGVRPENYEGTPVFDVPLLRFQLSDEKVRELLMGRQLYGEPDLAIRELYQNALDACRYRHVRRQYRERLGRALADWSGHITFTQGSDADGREYIECVDNGVGMNKETLMSTFANAGERFVYRSTFRAEQARWQDLDPPLRLVPNSQFGVGVFSYFMIAEEIQIVTRPVGPDDGVSSKGYSVRIASSGSLFQITPSADMPTGGTRVRLYLTGEDRLSVLRTLRRLLWIAEYVVDVNENGATRETWQPEILRFPDASVEPLKDSDNLWWVPGEGGFAADGIRTNEKRYGLILNPRGPHRPQFTVDRNRLRSWDKQWVREQILHSLPALTQWVGLTLSWLWGVAENTPSIAEEIFGYLIDNKQALHVEGAWGRTMAPIERVGCLALDRELFTGEMIPWYGGPHRAWIAAWRVGAWKGIATFVGAENIPSAERLDGFPIVRPLDANVLHAVYYSGSYHSPSRFGLPSVSDLLEASTDEEESPATRLRRLRRYAITGLDLTAGREIPPVRHRFTEKTETLPPATEEKHLIGAVAAWSPPGKSPRTDFGYYLALTSALLRIPLEEVVSRASALVPADWVPPDVGSLGDLRERVFTWGDVELFTQDLYRGSPKVDLVLPPAHVMRISAKLGCSVDQALRTLDRFKPLGYVVAGRDVYPEDLTYLECEALRYAEKYGFKLTWLHLMVLAHKANIAVEKAHADVERLVRLGMVGTPCDSVSISGEVSDEEYALISNELSTYDRRSSTYLLMSGWLATRSLAQEVGGHESHDFEGQLRLRRRLLDAAGIHRQLTMPEVIDLAYYLDYSVAATIENYCRLYPESADLSAIPAAAFEATEIYCRRYEEWLALLGVNEIRDGRREVKWALKPGDIVNGAMKARQSIAGFVDRIEPYRAFGAPVPHIDALARDQLGRRPADRYDHGMLVTVNEYGVESFVESVSPLRLMQIAGKFGWTIAEAHSRFAALAPLGLRLEYSPEACIDELVSWQDLLVVTENVDGQAPVLSGAVEARHLATCAAEIDESVDQVSSRLRRYEPLFGFRF